MGADSDVGCVSSVLLTVKDENQCCCLYRLQVH